MSRVLPLLGLLACEGPQHMLDPRGPAAAEIAELWWMMLALIGFFTVLTIAWILVAPLRNRQPLGSRPDPSRAVDRRREQTLILALGFGVPTVVVLGILVRSVSVGHAVTPIPGPPATTIEVTGHKFWWEVRYPDDGVVTANELYIPVGEPVRIRLTSADVIHSFWVPNLQGKLDMMPGRWLDTWLLADTPGRYRGQCAEFCGRQHALMAFWVVALPPEDFEAWLAPRRRPEPPPEFGALGRGREVFFEARCDQCHAVRGVTPPSRVERTGPDLTHLGSRLTLGAATLPNNRGNLYGWILDPQAHKPGVRMPDARIEAADMDALVTFLEALQ